MRRRAPRVPLPARPKVLILVTLAERGGVVSYLSALVPGLTSDYDVTVAAWGPGPLATAMRAAGAEFVELHQVRRAISPLRDPLGLLELIRLCRRLRPQILHANSTKAGVLGRLAAWLTGVPVRLFTSHGWAFATHPGATARLYRWSDRLMRPITTTTICVSQSERARGLHAQTCAAARTVVIPNGTPLDVPLARGTNSGGPLRLVSVGRMAPPKDFITILRAVARLGGPPHPYRVEIIGDGPDLDAVRREIDRLGIGEQTVLSGERPDVPARLAAGDVYVLSSHSEAMPMVVLEAMAAGLPVVASAVGGVPELVAENENGLLVTPGDPAALADALRRLAQDRPLRERLGATGRARAERDHSLDAMRRRYADLYREALAEAHGLESAP